MVLGRKTVSLLVVLGVLGFPALLLRFLCVGNSCDEQVSASSEVPFCSLDAGLRSRLEDGFREGRSPEVLVVARSDSIAGGTGYRRTGVAPPWPSSDLGGARVPLLFTGEGVTAAELPAGTSVTDIAPTLAEVIDFERPFPEVRSGEAIPGVAQGEAPRLLLQVIWKGVGSEDLEGQPERWPYLASLMDEGAATLEGDTGSLPLEPAAVISTIGTGGSPSQHGITGELVRNDEGELVGAFSAGAESPVIATLGDDLDEVLGQEPLVGVVGASPSDRGASGGEWYGAGSDSDEVVIDRKDQVGPAVAMLSGGFGTDEVPDLMSVVMNGDLRAMDRGLKRIVAAAVEASDGSLALALTATGSAASEAGMTAAEVATEVDEAVGETVTEAAVPGGLFLDQRALTDLEISEDEVIAELRRLRGPDGALFGDVFAAIAVSFARFC